MKLMCAHDELGFCANAQDLHDVPPMVGHGGSGNVETTGDLNARPAAQDELEDLLLLRCKVRRRHRRATSAIVLRKPSISTYTVSTRR